MKLKKLLSVFLAVIMVISVSTISASAKEMAKDEVIKFYHSILRETAEKHKVILVKNEYDSKNTSDFSALSGLDLKLTEKRLASFNELNFYDGGEFYYYGVCSEYEEASDSEIYEEFCLTWDLELGYEIKNAVYADNKIQIELEENQEYYSNQKIIIELTNGNTINKITKEVYEEIESYSVIKNIPFITTYESVDVFTFIYDEVPATSLTLSETNITLGYEDTAEITYTVGPKNASFKGIDVYSAEDENGIIAYAYEEDGKIIIEAWGEGKGSVEVYTVSGEILATCDVTVEYTMWDRLRSIFDYIFSWFNLFFWI